MTARLALLGAALALSACASSRPEAAPRDLVVLAHGMGRTSLSMVPLHVSLHRAGYRVLNVGYSSQGPSVAQIGAQIGHEVEAALDAEAAPQVHYVGHSLGTVAIRWHLLHEAPEAAGRVVMLAPPNQGSHEADRLARWVGWMLPPIRELRTTGGTAVSLGPPPGVEVAVIAGDRDGKVRVEETCLEGAAHAVVPSRHTFIMMRPRVLGMVRTFLATGVLPEADASTCADRLGAG
ncbi:MAG: alpha/beta hydrolase [Bacteroidota bacterium]